MFSSLEEVTEGLRHSGYIVDSVTTTAVYLAATLHKPVLLEGPAGSGKTQLAYAVAEAADTKVERLQCYQGISEDKAIGKFDESLQQLCVDLKARSINVEWDALQVELHGRKFFSAGQLSIPKLGTVRAESVPFVVLTSNEERRIGDPLRRRSFYLRVEHPSAEREAEIVALKTPDASREFHAGMAGLAKALRGWSLEKPPSISEILDLAQALKVLGEQRVTPEMRDLLLPLLAKTEADRRKLCLRDGFASLVHDAQQYTQEVLRRVA